MADPANGGPPAGEDATPAQAALREAYSRPEKAALPVVNGRGVPVDCEANVVHILEHDALWRGVVALDEFAARPVKRRVPPFRFGEAGPWTDLDDTELQVWVTLQYGFRVSAQSIQAAVNLVAARARFNEVRDWLAGLRWDGKRRLSRWLEAYLGAGDAIGADQEAAEVLRYIRRVAVKTLIGMVARVFEPGCKLDTMTVFEGPQGVLKSSAWRALGGRWFTDAYLDVHSKEPMAIILGMWVVEWSELEALNRAEISAVKRFLSQPEDRYRTWYGRRAENVKRRCVFVGSTNETQFLRDSENRRFWPIRVGYIDIEGLRRDREQLFAEAVRWYRRGVRWWVQGDERELFMAQQERRHQHDAFEERIRAYLDPPATSTELPRHRVTVAEVLEGGLGLKPDRWTVSEQKRVAQALSRIGFERRQVRIEGSWKTRSWVYVRPGYESEP